MQGIKWVYIHNLFAQIQNKFSSKSKVQINMYFKKNLKRSQNSNWNEFKWERTARRSPTSTRLPPLRHLRAAVALDLAASTARPRPAYMGRGAHFSQVSDFALPPPPAPQRCEPQMRLWLQARSSYRSHATFTQPALRFRKPFGYLDQLNRRWHCDVAQRRW